MNQEIKDFIFHRDYLPDNKSCNDEEVKEYLKILIDCIFYLPVDSWESYINEKYKNDRYFKLLALNSLQRFISDKEKYAKMCSQNKEKALNRWHSQHDTRKAEILKNYKRDLDW